MIKFANVSYIYPNGAIGLDGFNLSIDKSERVALIGNNGSGKTTFAHLLNGILKPSSGEIEVDGLNPSSAEECRIIRQKVGLVFQNPDNQLVSSTVEREIAFSLENMNVGHPEILERVEKSMEFFDLSSIRHRLTSELSGGEKQRAALASVMVAEPEILVLDEPESYLDESGRKNLSEAISMLMERRRELSVIRITQYSYVAGNYQRVIVFHKGKVASDGTPEETFSQTTLCHLAGVQVPLKYRIQSHVDFPKQRKSKLRSDNMAISGQKIILMKSVSFKYELAATDLTIRDVNLEIRSDKIYGLVGQSGSGKTTLAQLMAGLLKPTGGKLAYEGFSPHAGALAVSFQHPERQFFLDTVDKEIRFGAENVKIKDIDQTVEDYYRLIGLPKESFAHRDPFTLSGGEKRRLAFGTVLSMKPSFIFFDEPTSGLDAEAVELFTEMVLELRAGGTGIIIISHHGDMIFELTDDIIALRGGVVDAVLSKKDFFGSYDHSTFLSTPELVKYQLQIMGEIRFFEERELAEFLHDTQQSIG